MARRVLLRRMLVGGASVGLAAGLLAQPYLGGVDAEVRSLARLALLLPGLVFLAWWLFTPDVASDTHGDAPTAPGTRDVEARMTALVAAIDGADAPRAGRPRPGDVDDATREELRRTVPRPGSRDADAAQFRVRRQAR